LDVVSRDVAPVDRIVGRCADAAATAASPPC